jgi:type II secretory pathway component PulF
MAAGRIHNFAFFLLTFYFPNQINQFESIMQNKPNLPDALMNVSSVLAKDYENVRLR